MRSPVMVAYGAGVNSKALVAEMVRRSEPIDLIIFSDPGAEDPDTYRDMRSFEEWLVARGYPSITRVYYRTKNGVQLSLEQDIRARHTLPAIAFGWKSCSEKHKTRPQERFVKTWSPAVAAWGAGLPVIKLVGYHAGEQRRVDGAPSDSSKYARRYPLVEWGWTNVRCAAELRLAGLPVPPKSSCYFCPSKKPAEILDMKRRHLPLYERALEIEADARAHGVEMAGLGRRFSWRDVKESTPDPNVPLPCECFEGGSDDDDSEAA